MKKRTWAGALVVALAVAAMATTWAVSAQRPITLAAPRGALGLAAAAAPSPGRPAVASPDAPPAGGPTSSPAPDGQPNQPVLPDLVPGQAPPQFVVFSWDGAAEDSNKLFSRFRAVAKANDASMTYFLSGIYTLPQSRRMLYQPPGHKRGASDIPLLKDSQIAVTMQEVRQAWLEGSEIGTHFNGHFCGPRGGASFTVQDWASELGQAKGFIAGWRANNGLMSTPPLPFDVSKEIVGGRAPCLEGQANLIPAEKAAGFRYDASSPGGLQVWPSKLDGIWNYPLQSLPVPGSRYEILSMDYNFMFNQSRVTQGDPARFPLWQTQTRDALVGGFNRAYTGNRAPMFVGNHFERWNGGIYMNAIEDTVKTVCGKPEVHCVSFRQLTDWMDRQKPARLAALRTLGVGQPGDWAKLLK
jgi:hypothetical protein